MQNHNSESGYYRNQPNPGGCLSKLSMKMRKKMYLKLIEITGADSRMKILDVGVTNDRRIESNFLEKLYPYKENITTTGIEDASFIQKECRGVKFIQADGMNLPFGNRSFDLVTCFAVIEHVGNNTKQKQLINELCRVGKSCIITTPNRWYPIEVHTMMPFIHWLPPECFRKILRVTGQVFYSKEKNLSLLDAKTLKRMIPERMKVNEHHHRLMGIVSNLFFHLK